MNVDLESEARKLLRSVDNAPFWADSSPQRPQEGSPLQIEIDRASAHCTAYSGLCRRLEFILTAIRGGSSHAAVAARSNVPPAPKSMSWIEGQRFINDCNAAVLTELAHHVEELELLLAVVPRETRASSKA